MISVRFVIVIVALLVAAKKSLVVVILVLLAVMVSIIVMSISYVNYVIYATILSPFSIPSFSPQLIYHLP